MGGGNCLKYLKRGGKEKRGDEKRFKKSAGGKLCQGMGMSASKSPHFLWYVITSSLIYCQ